MLRLKLQGVAGVYSAKSFRLGEQTSGSTDGSPCSELNDFPMGCLRGLKLDVCRDFCIAHL